MNISYNSTNSHILCHFALLSVTNVSNERGKFRSADSHFSHNNANASQERANPPQYPETLATNQLTRFSSIHNNNDNISYAYKSLVEF